MVKEFGLVLPSGSAKAGYGSPWLWRARHQDKLPWPSLLARIMLILLLYSRNCTLSRRALPNHSVKQNVKYSTRQVNKNSMVFKRSCALKIKYLFILFIYLFIYLLSSSINQQWHRSTSKEHTGRMTNTGLTNHSCAAT